MLSLQLVREHPDVVRKALRDRQATDDGLHDLLGLDGLRRTLLQEIESLKAKRNAAGKQIGAAKDAAERKQMIDEMRSVSERIDELEPQVRDVEERLNQLLLELPNLPEDSVPYGKDDSENVVVRYTGEPRPFDFKPLPHWEIGERLDIIDLERGARMSGSRFYVLKGAGARLQRALIAWMLDVHTRGQGYTEMYTPFVVKEETMLASGQLPKFRDNLYHDVEDDVWLIPTSEVTLTNLHRDEILDGDELPLLYTAYSPCFRREKMSAGRDVRGIKRGHQFDKVEMYAFTRPEQSDEMLERMTRDAEETIRGLGLPYRVKLLCSGDLGFAAAKTYDLEVWSPGSEEWLEVSSISNCTDFQARRASIRFRREPGSKPEFVHTLNGSGLALPRMLASVLETFQREDGSVDVPEPLHPYMADITRIEPPPGT